MALIVALVVFRRALEFPSAPKISLYSTNIKKDGRHPALVTSSVCAVVSGGAEFRQAALTCHR